MRYWYLIIILLISINFSECLASERKLGIIFDASPVIHSSDEVLQIGDTFYKGFQFFSSILDTIRNHDNLSGGIYYLPYDSIYFATRLTIPNQVASLCTLKRIRLLVRYPNPTPSALCSIFIWRDTIINNLHRPGAIIRRDTINLSHNLQPGYLWRSVIYPMPIVFNRNENFWIGVMNLNTNFNFVSDATDNPDSTRNLTNLGSGWQSYAYDFIFEAVVSYEPRDNNIGTIEILNIPKVIKGNTITSVKATVKNFGRNTLDPGIPVIMNIAGPSFSLVDTEYTTNSLAQNNIDTITFSEDWQVPPITGDYEVSVWTAFNLDSIYNNDTTKMSVFVYNSGVRETFSQYDFPPSGWLIFDFNNDNYWRRDSYPSGYYTSPAGAIITYDEYPYSPNNDWLVSPKILANTSDSIIFFYRAASSGRMETLLVRMNTNPITTDTGNYQIIQIITTNNFNWQKNVIALDNYLTGPETISIAFHYPCYNKFYLALDDIIMPEPIRSVDVFTANIEAPLLPIIVDSTYIPKAKFRNNSYDNSTEFLTVNMYYQIVGESTFYFDSIIGEPIYHGNYEIFNFASFNPIVSETVSIKVWIYNSEDENNSNDTLIKRIFIAPKYQTVPYTANFNENWGKYGDNPPLGGWRIIDGGNERNPMWNTNDWHKDTIRSGGILREVVKVSYSPIENSFEWLISPRLNCSMPGNYSLSYWHWYRDYSVLTPDSGVVLISNNGGQSWQRLIKYSNVSDVGVRLHDISGIVSGHNDVRICFLYGARDEWFWCVDDFTVTWLMGTPNLVFPPNGLDTIAEAIDLIWRKVLGANKYVLQIAYDSTFLFPIISETLYNDTTYRCSLPPYRYYWKVKAGDPYGMWSEIWHFTLIEPPPPFYGWERLDSIITMPYGKAVKDGGALTFCLTDSSIYALKGNNTRDFCAFNINQKRWRLERPIGLDSLKIRYVKKGSALCAGDTFVYAVKGNSNEFWAYHIYQDTWIRKKSIPQQKIKGGSAIVYVKKQKDYEEQINDPIGGYDVKGPGNKKDNRFESDMIFLLKGGNKDCEFYAYLVDADSWIRKRNAPTAMYNKIFKDGSALVYDGGNKIYAIKGGSKVNEFYYYDIFADTWYVLENESIPLKYSNESKKRKIKIGGSLARIDSRIFAIKGGGCNEFWCFDTTSRIWTALETIPWNNNPKSVPKSGAAITAAIDKVYLLKGNNTNEFWSILPVPPKISKDNLSDVNYVSNVISHIASSEKNNHILSHLKIIVINNNIQRQLNIQYEISKPCLLGFKITDLTGRVIKNSILEYIKDGRYNTNIDTKDMKRGIYFIVFENNGKIIVNKKFIIE